MTEHKFTDDEIIRALENCADGSGTGLIRATLDLIKRYKAEIEQLKHQYDLAVAEREANVKGFTAEVAELQSEIKVLKDSNINLQELYQTEREKVAKAKEKVFEIGRALQSARAEIEALKASKVSEVNFAYKVTKEKAIKEFAESIKLEFYREFDEIIPSIMADRIDNLVKEMTEGES